MLEVVTGISSDRYSVEQFQCLPANIVEALCDRCKSANLLSETTMPLFFRPGMENLVLSGASSYVDHDVFVRCLAPSIVVAPHTFTTVGLYNIKCLMANDIYTILTHIPHCTNLNLGRLPLLNNSHTQSLHIWTPKLQILVLNRNSQLTDLALQSLPHLQSLSEISLFHCCGLRDPVPALVSPALTALNVSRVPGFTEQKWKDFAAGTPNLRSLTAQSQPHLSGETLVHALRHWSSLTHLDLLPFNPNTDVSHLLEALQKNLVPHLHSLSFAAPDVDYLMAQCITSTIQVLHLDRGILIPSKRFAEALSRPKVWRIFSCMRPADMCFSDSCLQSVLRPSCWPYLRELYLTGCAPGLSPAPWENLPPFCLSELRILEVADCASSVTGIAIERIIQACPALTQLNLSRNPVTLDHAPELARRLPALRNLNLSECEYPCWTDEFVAALVPSRVALFFVRNLNASRSCLSFHGMMELVDQLPHLAILDVSYTTIGQHRESCCTRKLQRKFNVLSSLSLDGNPGIPKTSWALFLPFLPCLSFFSAQDVDRVDDAIFLLPSTLLTCKLRNASDLSGEALIFLASKCHRLNVLDLSGCDDLHNNAVYCALHVLPNINVLDISNCSRLTDDCIHDVTLTELESFSCKGTKITPAGAQKLRRRQK